MLNADHLQYVFIKEESPYVTLQNNVFLTLEYLANYFFCAEISEYRIRCTKTRSQKKKKKPVSDR